MISSRAIGFLGMTLLIIAIAPGSAEAQDWTQVILTRAKELAAFAILVFIIVQAGAIYVFARLLRLEGGVITALLALVLGVVFTVVAAIPLSFVVGVIPPLVAQVIATAAGFACGGLAVKLLFSASFGHGMLVYVLASTVTLIASSIGLVLVL
jgi:hypothetical protein